jgi:hypothetical protein
VRLNAKKENFNALLLWHIRRCIRLDGGSSISGKTEPIIFANIPYSNGILADTLKIIMK